MQYGVGNLRNVFRMRQFFEAYTKDEKVSALLTQLPSKLHEFYVLTERETP